MKLNIIGTIFGSSGYDSHTRQLFNALYELNSDTRLDVSKPENWEMLCNDAELNALTKPFTSDMTTIMIATPQYWRLGIADNPKHFIGFCVWEGDKIPKYWMEYLLDPRVDQIWVPSQHTKDAIEKTLMEDWEGKDYKILDKGRDWDKIKIVPHGADLNIFKPAEKEKDSDIFTFLSNKGWRGGWEDRGGVAYVLKAFCEEFNKDEKVELILKLNPAYINPQTVFQELDKLGLTKDRPQIKVECSNLSTKKLVGIYNESNVYVCAQRADGFNLPGIEAMGCGLPTIQTTFGGQVDYMTLDNSWNILVKEKELVKSDILYEGVKWAIPDVDDLKKVMRYCYENKDEVKQKGQQALIDVKNWTWRHSGQKAINFLKEIN